MAQITFVVQNQTIRRTDRFNVVADSHSYLYAGFEFTTDEWDDIEKTAIFTRNGTSYEVLIEQDGECLVPHEVLAGKGMFDVSVFGGSLITVNVANVHVVKSGYTDDLESSTEPTPGIYEQILTHVQNLEDIAEQVGDAMDAAERAETSETNAAVSAQAAASSEANAEASATAAAASETAAKGYDESARGAAQAAEISADRAEQAAASAGFMFMDVVDGRLVYTRTDAVDVDFALDDGHLIMEAV